MLPDLAAVHVHKVLQGHGNIVLIENLWVMGIPVTLLSLVGILAMWYFLVSLSPVSTRWEPGRLIGFLVLATALSALTFQWSAASMLFIIAVLVLDVAANAVLERRRA